MALGFTSGDPRKVNKVGDTMTGPLLIRHAPDVTLDVSEALTSTISTGTLFGGEISVNPLNPAAIDVTPVTGYVYDEFAQELTRLELPAQTIELDGPSLARVTTWFLIDKDGVVTQQAPRPGPAQRRSHLVLGAVGVFGGAIAVVENVQGLGAHQIGSQAVDLMDSLAPFSASGNLITPNGANLMIDTTGGLLFARNFSTFATPDNPNQSVTIPQAPCTFRYATRSTVLAPLVQNIDVANFDNGGVVTPIGGGANTSTVHRVWVFGTASPTDQMAIQYGQQTFGSLSAAVAAIGTGIYVPNPDLAAGGAIVAFIAATRTATNLSDPTQAGITSPVGKFGAP